MWPSARPCMCFAIGAVVLLAPGASPLRADDAGDLATVVKGGHKAAVESIRTVSATFTYEAIRPKQEVIAQGRYWRTPDAVRVQEGKEGEGVSDSLVKGGEIRQVGRSWQKGGQVRYNVGRRPGAEMLGLSDVWMGMLMVVVGPHGQPLTIDRLCEAAKQPPRFARETVDGRKFIRVKLEFDAVSGHEVRLTLWHDINSNYPIRKVTWDHPDAGAHESAEVTEFAEPSPGVLMPVKCRRQRVMGGEVKEEWVMSVTNLEVNREISPQALQLPSIPDGTSMRDLVRGTKYTVDSAWNRTGPEVAAPRASMGTAGESAADHTTQSVSEPRSGTSLIMYASGAVLAVGVVTGVLNRGRRRTLPS